MFLSVLATAANRVTDTEGLTTTTLILIAIFAAFVLFGIVHGMRQKRIRAAAEEEERLRNEEIHGPQDAEAPEPEAEPEPAPLPTPAAPVAPPPPPPPPPSPAPEPVAAPKVAAVAPEPTPPPKAAPKAAPKPKLVTKPKAEPKPKAAVEAKPEPTPAPVTEPAPVSKPEPAPVPAPTPEPAAATGYVLNDVKGLGPKAAALLTDMGIDSVAALAALDPARAAEVDGKLGPFAGRLSRDRWVEQAKLLDSGQIVEFEATFGKI